MYFTTRCIHDLEDSKFGSDYTVTFASNAATILEGGEYKFSGYLKEGDVKRFKAKMIINKPSPTVSIAGIITAPRWPPQDFNLVIFLVDEQTGQYGTREEYEGRLPVEYRYDPLVGTFTCSPSQNPAPVEENRAILKMIKQLAPTLSDSLAFVLHSEQYRVGIPNGLPHWDSLSQRWKEEEIFEYYLRDGWLEAVQENRLDIWREQEKKKIESGWKKGSLNFFRPNSICPSFYHSTDFYHYLQDKKICIIHINLKIT